MKIDINKKYMIVTPEVGMWLTDGKNISNKLFMPKSADVSAWHEISESEKEAVETANAIVEDTILAEAKMEKIKAIDEYSNSNAVNGFVYNGKQMWIDRQDRIILVGETIPVAEMLGKTDITLSLGDIVVTMAIDYVKQVLNAITAYAVNCYEITNSKKAAVNACESIEDVDAISVSDGYPEMLVL